MRSAGPWAPLENSDWLLATLAAAAVLPESLVQAPGEMNGMDLGLCSSSTLPLRVPALLLLVVDSRLMAVTREAGRSVMVLGRCLQPMGRLT
jgi:hypothetical protein